MTAPGMTPLDGVLGRLTQLAGIKRAIAAEEKQLVGKARDLNATWGALDQAMGYCRGTNHQRWHDRYPKRCAVSKSGQLGVECPKCGVEATATCRSKGGHPLNNPHAARIRAAEVTRKTKNITRIEPL